MKAGLWVGGSSDLYCKVRMGAEEVAFNLDFGQHFGDVCVLSFLLGKGLEAVMGFLSLSDAPPVPGFWVLRGQLGYVAGHKRLGLAWFGGRGKDFH